MNTPISSEGNPQPLEKLYNCRQELSAKYQVRLLMNIPTSRVQLARVSLH